MAGAGRHSFVTGTQISYHGAAFDYKLHSGDAAIQTLHANDPNASGTSKTSETAKNQEPRGLWLRRRRFRSGAAESWSFYISGKPAGPEVNVLFRNSVGMKTAYGLG
jgi:hypothetical protein